MHPVVHVVRQIPRLGRDYKQAVALWFYPQSGSLELLHILLVLVGQGEKTGIQLIVVYVVTDNTAVTFVCKIKEVLPIGGAKAPGIPSAPGTGHPAPFGQRAYPGFECGHIDTDERTAVGSPHPAVASQSQCRDRGQLDGGVQRVGCGIDDQHPHRLLGGKHIAAGPHHGSYLSGIEAALAGGPGNLFAQAHRLQVEAGDTRRGPYVSCFLVYP